MLVIKLLLFMHIHILYIHLIYTSLTLLVGRHKRHSILSPETMYLIPMCPKIVFKVK